MKKRYQKGTYSLLAILAALLIVGALSTQSITQDSVSLAPSSKKSASHYTEDSCMWAQEIITQGSFHMLDEVIPGGNHEYTDLGEAYEICNGLAKRFVPSTSATGEQIIRDGCGLFQSTQPPPIACDGDCISFTGDSRNCEFKGYEASGSPSDSSASKCYINVYAKYEISEYYGCTEDGDVQYP